MEDKLDRPNSKIPTREGVEEDIARYEGLDEKVSNEIRRIANGGDSLHSVEDYDDNHALDLQRTISHMSRVPGVYPIHGDSIIDPRLDPNSDEFDTKFWIKNLRKLYKSDPEYYKPMSLSVVYKDLRAYGIATDADYQANFLNAGYKFLSQKIGLVLNKNNESAYFDILKPMDGILNPGELTVVLGRPGAGCSTFLKSISGHTYGFNIDKNSVISYDGLTHHDIVNHYRGEVVYCAETENHFPHLTVGDTLEFAAKMRTPRNRPSGITRNAYAKHMADVVLAMYGLTNTKNTKVGNEYIRGVSGGERKRVSIAEVALSFANVQCWDNSTRGLDSATALEFIKALKASAVVLEATPLIAIYQCSQEAYDLFDKVVVLYEGYQIFFGGSEQAKSYFLDMGYECPERQTTADFLTSLTNPLERIVKRGFENKVPRTPKEFYEYWQKSKERRDLLEEIDGCLSRADRTLELGAFGDRHLSRKSKHTSKASPYTVSFPMQVRYIMGRNILRTKGDPSITLFSIFGNFAMSLIISSIFYNLSDTTESFYYRTAAMFFAVLFNSFSSLLEIFSLYEARPIVEKHKTYALYHPSADACASIITEMPTKVVTAIAFNLVFYFMVNFYRDAGHFFFYLLVNFTGTLAMSHLFRTIGSATKSLSQAMTPASVILLALTIFTGFVVPTPNMHGWCRWINYLDPVAFAFEALIANEFHGREFDCSQFVPMGPGYPTKGDSIVCSTVGSQLGNSKVNGDDYINTSFQYYWSHRWRGWGICLAFAVFFLGTYLVLCEYNRGAMQKGEILVFQRKALKKKKPLLDIESGELEKVSPEFNESSSSVSLDLEKGLVSSRDIFHWRGLTYTVQIKSEERTILNSIDGWVKPGQVTALMGATGAGKTTLLNALSERLTSGVVKSGTRMVNGHSLDNSFERCIGYVQQQDLHLETSTVREALRFSVYLRQPFSVSKQEKEKYVDQVIELLEMENYSDAVVGVSGEGLNVEQRKRLTIGVELVAKPKLLLFLDEPTSGLDSQTAWSICKLIRKLADHGQAILCTIHQPSAILLQEFDRLLFLQKGGETVYFGDLGENCKTLINYFEKYGSSKCPPNANPAEWMLEVIGAAPGSHSSQNYYQVWLKSSEYKEMNEELDKMEKDAIGKPKEKDPEKLKQFAAPIWYQYLLVTERVFEQYWRTPSYTYSKVLMCIASSLFNGFVFFKAENSVQGLQNQMFSVFMFLVVFQTLVQQYLPLFVSQRDLYEVRERPSRTFSWIAFVVAQITAEIPWQIFTGTIAFFCWYYPLGLYRNAQPTNTEHKRGALMWISIVLFYVYTTTMAQLCISFMDLAENAANLASLLFTMCLTFCGVLVSGDSLPRFWIFMYRCNPFTYLVSIIMSVGLVNSKVECAKKELLEFKPEDGKNCWDYMQKYILQAGGYLVSNETTDVCQYCQMSTTNVFLKQIGSNYSEKGRNFGIFIAFIAINIVGTILFYWLTRVPKLNRQKKKNA